MLVLKIESKKGKGKEKEQNWTKIVKERARWKKRGRSGKRWNGNKKADSAFLISLSPLGLTSSAVSVEYTTFLA